MRIANMLIVEERLVGATVWLIMLILIIALNIVGKFQALNALFAMKHTQEKCRKFAQLVQKQTNRI